MDRHLLEQKTPSSTAKDLPRTGHQRRRLVLYSPTIAPDRPRPPECHILELYRWPEGGSITALGALGGGLQIDPL